MPPETAIQQADAKIEAALSNSKLKAQYDSLNEYGKSLVRNAMGLHPEAKVEDLLAYATKGNFSKLSDEHKIAAMNVIAAFSAHTVRQPNNTVARNTLENFTKGTVDLTFIEEDERLYGQADSIKGEVQLNLNNPAIMAAYGYTEKKEAYEGLIETVAHEISHLDSNMIKKGDLEFQGVKYSEKNIAAEVLDEYTSFYNGRVAATGKQPTAAEMKELWLVMVGRSYKDTSASLYKQLAEARKTSPRFDQVLNDVYSLLCSGKLVTPTELRDRLLGKLDSKWYLLQPRDKTLDDNTYLKTFGPHRMDNKIEQKIPSKNYVIWNLFSFF
ncbi:MAG: hypothetical protein RMM17_04155 [Acidobacteriota bacterium]|nr:hypothetical protein [Blastocatellia bacterium]MDW8411854.1 hypothetical protein [Acidobacteriota bacterium]